MTYPYPSEEPQLDPIPFRGSDANPISIEVSKQSPWDPTTPSYGNDENPIRGSVQQGPTLKDRLAGLGHALLNVMGAMSSQSSGGGYSDSTNSPNLLNELTYQPSQTNLSQGSSHPVNYRQIKLQAVQSYGTNAMAKVTEQRAQADKAALQQTHQNVSNMLDQLSKAQGLPTYREWHAQNGIAYSLPPDPGTLGLVQRQSPKTGNYRIQEDRQQIQANLQHGQKPLQYADWQAAQPQERPANTGNLLDGFKTNLAGQTQLVASGSASPMAQSKSNNAWQNLQSGAVLDDSDLKHVFHAIDLRYYRANTEQDKRQAELLQLYAVDKQAENMVAQAERDKEGNVLLSGVPVRPSDALYFARLDVQHFEQTDMHLQPEQLLTAKQKYFDQHEMSQINQRTQQIINESHNTGDTKAVHYFANTANHATGENSLKPPIPTKDLGTGHYYISHGLFGKGNDLITDIENITFTNDSQKLKDSFWGKGEYKADKGLANPLPNELLKLKNGEVRKIVIPQVKIQTMGEQKYSLGKVKMKAEGILYKTRNGQAIFKGTIEQGNNAEVLTFPRGNRKDNPEDLTTWGREHYPGTMFRTIIKGKKEIILKL